MSRLARLHAHLSPQAVASPAAVHVPVLEPEGPSAELVARHCAGSGELWQGPRSFVHKAMELFMNEGITNFPIIDLDVEIRAALKALRGRFAPIGAQQHPIAAPAWRMETVLLTGATGFLGNHLLMNMLKSFPRSRIYCLVRGKNEAHCLERIMEAAREYGNDTVINQHLDHLVAIKGDIAKPQLGMSSSDYATLSRTVDTAVHLAARDNFFLPYAVLRPAHVDALLHMVDFCRNIKMKPLVQTCSCTHRLIESGMCGPKQVDGGLYNGYTQSKYVGFCIFQELARLGATHQLVPPVCQIDLGYVHPH